MRPAGQGLRSLVPAGRMGAQRHLWVPPVYIAPQFGQKCTGLSARMLGWAVGVGMMGTASR